MGRAGGSEGTGEIPAERGECGQAAAGGALRGRRGPGGARVPRGPAGGAGPALRKSRSAASSRRRCGNSRLGAGLSPLAAAPGLSALPRRLPERLRGGRDGALASPTDPGLDLRGSSRRRNTQESSVGVVSVSVARGWLRTQAEQHIPPHKPRTCAGVEEELPQQRPRREQNLRSSKSVSPASVYTLRTNR